MRVSSSADVELKSYLMNFELHVSDVKCDCLFLNFCNSFIFASFCCDTKICNTLTLLQRNLFSMMNVIFLIDELAKA